METKKLVSSGRLPAAPLLPVRPATTWARLARQLHASVHDLALAANRGVVGGALMRDPFDLAVEAGLDLEVAVRHALSGRAPMGPQSAGSPVSSGLPSLAGHSRYRSMKPPANVCFRG